MDNKKTPTIIGVAVIIIIAVTVGMLVWKYENEKNRMKMQNITVQPKEKINNQSQKTVDENNWETYTNDEFYFSFKYPVNCDGCQIKVSDKVKRAYLHNDSQLLNFVTTKNGKEFSSPFIFTIGVMPAVDDNGKLVNNIDDFLKNYRNREKNPAKQEQDSINGVKTVEDIWPTGKTIYVYYQGVVYQIKIGLKDSEIPDKILSTFQFLKPETVARVDPPTTKPTDYVNNKLGFKLTFPVGWYFSSPDNEYPEIYNCLTKRGRFFGYDCDTVTVTKNLPDEIPKTFNADDNLSVYGKNAKIINNLIDGATAIRTDSVSKPNNPPVPAGFIYYLYFSHENKSFKAFVNDIKLERTILSSFKLVD